MLKKWQINFVKRTIKGWMNFVNDKKWINNSLENKKQLLKMAKAGSPKPVKFRHKLGQALYTYVNKLSTCYDSKFYEQIYKLAPQWFINVPAENKKQLLEMAKLGKPRPKLNDKLGSVLRNYTNNGNRRSKRK